MKLVVLGLKDGRRTEAAKNPLDQLRLWEIGKWDYLRNSFWFFTFSDLYALKLMQLVSTWGAISRFYNLKPPASG